MDTLEDKALLLLVIAVSLAFGWILWPFYGAILWGVVVAIMFAPVHRRVLVLTGQRRNLAALASVGVVVAIVILPLMLVGASLASEASGVYARIKSRQLDLVGLFQRVVEALPGWAAGMLDRFDLASLGAVQEKLTASLVAGNQYLAERVLGIGQSTFDFGASLFVMLYLLFFVLRDEVALLARIDAASPLRAEQLRALLRKFTLVVRATVRGDLLVAMLQGLLGGLGFWALGIGAPVLCAVLMAFLSLVPAVGAGILWVPVAAYLLATGAIWKGAILIAWGVLVIGLVDNFLRPVLVGQGSRMPAYIVLLSTLGGLATFGLNGFVGGPLIAAMFIAAWDIFSDTRRRVAEDVPAG